MLRRDAAGAILKIGLFVYLLLEKVIFLGIVMQRLYVDSQYSRQNAAFACEQLHELICTVDAGIYWNIRRIGDFVKQFDGVVAVVREPVGELLEDRSDQSRTDVIGQIERLAEVHENASREFGNAVQRELGCQGNSGGAVLRARAA